MINGPDKSDEEHKWRSSDPLRDGETSCGYGDETEKEPTIGLLRPRWHRGGN
jgi:hypothetical protein